MKRVAIAMAIVVCASSTVIAAQSYERLLETLERDEAYKVRMFAVRVLSKRLDKSTKPVPANVIEGLGQATAVDDSYLVRGMAVVALGKTRDVRARPYLEAALQDAEPFVRKQAQRALDDLPVAAPTPPPPSPPPPAPPPPGTSRVRQSLVVSAVEVPDVESTPELRAAMVAYLSQGLRAGVSDNFTVGQYADTKGFSLRGSIAENSVRPEGGEQRVTIVIKLTIATWPENNLRQVLSAKASAKTKTITTSSLAKLRKTLLRAAVDRVVKDSMAQLGGG